MDIKIYFLKREDTNEIRKEVDKIIVELLENKNKLNTIELNKVLTRLSLKNGLDNKKIISTFNKNRVLYYYSQNLEITIQISNYEIDDLRRDTELEVVDMKFYSKI